jgi:hypothetical protein
MTHKIQYLFGRTLNIWFKDKDCHWCQVGFTQIKLPWLLIATADAYANGSLLQRVKALSWIEQVLAQDGVTNSDTEPDNWWRAEVLYALRYVLEQNGDSPKQTSEPVKS